MWGNVIIDCGHWLVEHVYGSLPSSLLCRLWLQTIINSLGPSWCKDSLKCHLLNTPLQLRPNRIMCNAIENMNRFSFALWHSSFNFFNWRLLFHSLSRSSSPPPPPKKIWLSWYFGGEKSEVNKQARRRNWVKCKFDSALAVWLQLTCKECTDRLIQRAVSSWTLVRFGWGWVTCCTVTHVCSCICVSPLHLFQYPVWIHI